MTNPRPLENVSVLDFTRVLSGPYCTVLMADLGADVIKVESGEGDDYRHVGPFVEGESALFDALNRGKRSIALDLRTPSAIAAVRRLARRADVLVENFRPGVMDRLGLGWETLSASNPRLVYVSISGFGHTGPNIQTPAYDVIIQALSGIMHVTGDPAGPPTMIGEAIGDVAAGLFAAWGTAVALFDRERTGLGRHVDLAMFDALLAFMPTLAARHLLAGEEPTRVGNRHPLSAPFGVYRAGDGHFAVAVLNDRLFARFSEVIERPEMASEQRFSSDSLRFQNESALADAIEGWAAQRTAAQAVTALSSAGVPAATIASLTQAWQSQQAEERGLWSVVGHETRGELRVPEQPVHFSGAPRGVRSRAPRLDEHKQDILGEDGAESQDDE